MIVSDTTLLSKHLLDGVPACTRVLLILKGKSGSTPLSTVCAKPTLGSQSTACYQAPSLHTWASGTQQERQALPTGLLLAALLARRVHALTWGRCPAAELQAAG